MNNRISPLTSLGYNPASQPKTLGLSEKKTLDFLQRLASFVHKPDVDGSPIIGPNRQVFHPIPLVDIGPKNVSIKDIINFIDNAPVDMPPQDVVFITVAPLSLPVSTFVSGDAIIQAWSEDIDSNLKFSTHHNQSSIVDNAETSLSLNYRELDYYPGFILTQTIWYKKVTCRVCMISYSHRDFVIKVKDRYFHFKEGEFLGTSDNGQIIQSTINKPYVVE